MLGALVGDFVGSIYEFDNIKTEEFPLFSEGCSYTDDSVMTLAIAEALMNVIDVGAIDNAEAVQVSCVASLQRLGNQYPYAGYGGRFHHWLQSDNPRPYNSWGNGSAMRVSPVGWLFDSLEQTEEVAALTAAPTHNHPEGIKGAQATAVAIYLARTGADKADIKAVIEERYGYDLDRTLAQIRPTYEFVESCQGSVPEAIIAFLESNGFEDAIRKAVSLGGDSDTIAAIAGSIAQAYYGVPDEIGAHVVDKLPRDLRSVYDRWCTWYSVRVCNS